MNKYVKGFKFRIYPKPEHMDLLARSFGHSRFVYNQLLGKAISDYEIHKEDPTLPKPKVSNYDFVNQLPNLKEEYPWLGEVSSVALQQKAIHLGKAFSNFFKNLKTGKLAFPRFKKKSHRQSFTLMKTAFRVENNQLMIAKAISPIKVNWSRFLQLLIYKAKESHHCSIAMMHSFYPSSQLCTTCKTRYKDLKLSERTWVCGSCGTTHDRDLNASKNILQKGVEALKALSPKGDWVRTLVICDNEY